MMKDLHSLLFFFLNKSMLFSQQRCIKLIRSYSKDIYNVTKDFYFK